MRALRLTSPYAHGPDVAALQRALNAVTKDHPRLAPLAVDGQYGPTTDARAHQIAYLQGAKQATTGPLTPALQRIILHPRLRNPWQLARSRKRWAHFHRTHKGPDAAIAAVLAWYRSQEGVTEHPPGTNRGPLVSQWERDFGMDGQPWCGAFACYPLRHSAGIAVPNDVVFTPNIVHHAQSGTGGFASFHPWADREPGDLALFKWPGVSSDICDHVEAVDADKRHTWGGNTSSGNSGSQNNGGGVYRRDRGGANCIGVARPRWN